MILFYSVVSTLLVSIVSLSGIFLLTIRDKVLQKIVLYLVSFAIGSMLANVFFHLLPEAYEVSSSIEKASTLVLVGFLGSFIIEKYIHWHHCHNLHCKHAEPVGIMLLIGDALHNATDGMLIAASYMVSIPVGIATTIAIMLHEIPQEIGDFAVLIHSGYTRAKALLWNLCTALTALIGAIVLVWLHDHVSNIEAILLPIIAGNFLYIAGTDLLPTLQKQTKVKNSIIQLLSIIAGIALVFFLTSGSHSHAVHGDDAHDEERHDEVHNEHVDEHTLEPVGNTEVRHDIVDEHDTH